MVLMEATKHSLTSLQSQQSILIYQPSPVPSSIYLILLPVTKNDQIEAPRQIELSLERRYRLKIESKLRAYSFRGDAR